MGVGDGHRLALEEQLTGVDGEVAGQGLDHRRLAGAVVADEGDHLAGVDVEVGVVESPDVPEASSSPRASRMGVPVFGGASGRGVLGVVIFRNHLDSW